MYDLAMNVANSDLVIKDNDLLVIDNAERVAQQILITLRFWLGEWFLNTQDGIPYLDYVLIKNPNLSHIRQIFTEAIEKIDGVNRVASMDLDFYAVKRELEVSYSVETDYGLVTRKEVLGYGR